MLFRSALHAMPGNRASSRGEGEVSWVFSSCSRHVGYILEELQVRVEASEHAMHRTDKGDDAPQSQGNANLPTILAVIAGRLPIHILSLSVVANVIISFFFMAE